MLWQETWDAACKEAMNWVTRTVRRMTQRKSLKRWEKEKSNCEITPQAIRTIAKSFLKRDGPKAPTAINGHSGLNIHLTDKANAILNCLRNQLTSHHLRGGWRMEAKSPSSP
jgi:hypothetical protein